MYFLVKTVCSRWRRLRQVKEASQLCCPIGSQAYLPGTETYRDQEGGVSTARPIPCTPSGLTRTTTPNRGGSSAQFLLVGTSVRAVPLIGKEKKSLPSSTAKHCSSWSHSLFFCIIAYASTVIVIARFLCHFIVFCGCWFHCSISSLFNLKIKIPRYLLLLFKW